MRLIDADALKGYWLDSERLLYDYTAYHFTESIDEAPTVDPVKHGYWIIEGHTMTCSKCGERPLAMSNYCPHCGAVMDAPPPPKGKWRLLNGKWTCSECGNKTDWPLKICNVCASEMEIEL